jgi:hypothetical protein
MKYLSSDSSDVVVSNVNVGSARRRCTVPALSCDGLLDVSKMQIENERKKNYKTRKEDRIQQARK